MRGATYRAGLEGAAVACLAPNIGRTTLCMNEPERISRGEQLGLVVTNLTKLAGVVLAFVESLGRAEVRPGVIALCALMIAGAQGLENVLRGLFGK